MSTNMPIMWQNALMQYSTEIGRKAWVWFAETHGEGRLYIADKYAHEVENLVLFVKPLLAHANRHHNAADEITDDLLAFILKRHANHRLGGNVNPSYITR